MLQAGTNDNTFFTAAEKCLREYLYQCQLTKTKHISTPSTYQQFFKKHSGQNKFLDMLSFLHKSNLITAAGNFGEIQHTANENATYNSNSSKCMRNYNQPSGTARNFANASSWLHNMINNISV